jgi:hypothetical protein
MKPFADSSEQNKLPILNVLRKYLPDAEQVLEIGSGTGQHAVFFSREFPHLHWHASDRVENHPGITAWIEEASLANLYGPHLLDVDQEDWPRQEYDAVFSAIPHTSWAGQVSKTCFEGWAVFSDPMESSVCMVLSITTAVTPVIAMPILMYGSSNVIPKVA